MAGWQAMPFLTSDTGQVLLLVNVSLTAGIAANVVCLAYSGWSTAVRVLLVVAIAGSCIALVVQVVSLARWFTGRPPGMAAACAQDIDLASAFNQR